MPVDCFGQGYYIRIGREHQQVQKKTYTKFKAKMGKGDILVPIQTVQNALKQQMMLSEIRSGVTRSVFHHFSPSV